MSPSNTKNGHDQIPIIQHPSPNFNDRGNEAYPDLLILHYTGMTSGSEALDRLVDAKGEPPVSAHYLVMEDGEIIQMVDEACRAWHAGVSCWEGITDNNARSVGIEIVNPGHEFGYRPFPDVQMRAVLALSKGVIQRHNIDPWHVIGHSDVAPSRKQDPGELFDWAMLAKNGVGLWPEPQSSLSGDHEAVLKLGDSGLKVDDLKKRLKAYGYGPFEGPQATDGFDGELENIVVAFQRHFLQDKLDGLWCGHANHCLNWLLNKKAG